MTTPNRGQFRKGADPRRHKFTRDAFVAGFWAAITSIVTRRPEMIDAYGRHAACHFLKKRRRTNETN